LDVSYETIRRWFLKFGPAIAANLSRTRPRPGDHWHLDEMVIVIRRKHYWLWRAADNEGEVLDFLAQSRRNTSSTSIRRHTTSSITSGTSTGDRIIRSFELLHSMLGKPRVPPPDHRSLPAKYSATEFM
jgi:DDE superfamily endonuclease